MDIMLCPSGPVTRLQLTRLQSDVVTFIKFSESFAVRLFSSFRALDLVLL